MNQLLQEATQAGIIDLDAVAKSLEVLKRERILKEHYIWQGKNGYWYTKLENKLVKKNTREKVEEKILSVLDQKITVESIFKEWLSIKDISDTTVKRNRSIFNSYLQSIKDKNIAAVSEWDIECLVREYIEKGITAKEYANLRGILYGIFILAKKKGFIKYRIKEVFEEMCISRNSFKRPQQRKQVFNHDDYEIIIKYLKNNLNVINLGLLLMFATGLRVGELVSLEWADIDNYIINVNKTEDANNHIKQSPKTEASKRNVVISSKDRWIIDSLKEINPDTKYVFTYNDSRVRGYTIRKHLRKICKQIGIEYRPPHKIRKTYASKLLQSGVDKEVIKSQLGHVDFSTTEQFYLNDLFNLSERAAELEKVT